MKKIALTALAVLSLLSASLSAAQEAPKLKMRDEVIALNYVTVGDIEGVVRPFLSREGQTSYSSNPRLISIRDYPENVEKILAFIKKIDVKPIDMAFTIQLILASASDEAKTDESLAGDPLLKELGSFLRYKHFSLLDTSLVRAVDRQRSRVMLGTKETEFVLELQPAYTREERSDLLRINVQLSQRFGFFKGEGGADRLYEKTIIESNLSLKSGEKTVVGVSKMDGGDKGLILIISGKVVK